MSDTFESYNEPQTPETSKSGKLILYNNGAFLFKKLSDILQVLAVIQKKTTCKTHIPKQYLFFFSACLTQLATAQCFGDCFKISFHYNDDITLTVKDYQLQASLCKWLLMTECWTDATGCRNLKCIMNRENTHGDNLLWWLKGVLFILGKHAQIPTAFIGRFGQFAFPTQSLLQQLHKHKNIKAFHFFSLLSSPWCHEVWSALLPDPDFALSSLFFALLFFVSMSE